MLEDIKTDDQVKSAEQPQLTKEQMVNSIVSNAMLLINREIKLMAQDLITVLTTPQK